MTSRERILAAAHRQRPDMLPIALYMGNHGTIAAGGKLGECCRDGKKLADAQTKAWQLYRQDAVIVQSDVYYMAEAFGCSLRYHENVTPTLEKPAVADYADIAKLRKPDVEKDGRMHVYLEAIRILRERFGEEVAIRGCGTGPFVVAGHLMGTQKFLTELAQAHYGLGGDKSALLAMLEIACETLIDFVSRQIVLGATIVQCADSSASLDMISPEMYETYVFPFEKRFFSAIGPLCRKHNAVSLLHICGNNERVFHLYADTGADIVAVDHKASLEYAFRVMGDKVCIIGNLDPSSVLLLGTPREIEDAVENCMRTAWGKPGYILGSGCEVAPYTPAENIRTVLACARPGSDKGRIP